MALKSLHLIQTHLTFTDDCAFIFALVHAHVCAHVMVWVPTFKCLCTEVSCFGCLCQSLLHINF